MFSGKTDLKIVGEVLICNYPLEMGLIRTNFNIWPRGAVPGRRGNTSSRWPCKCLILVAGATGSAHLNLKVMTMDIHVSQIMLVAFSILLGGLIGLEREIADKPAGLRTHMLVAGASTLLVILGDFMIRQYSGSPMVDAVMADPIRIMEAIITGISFLGAGTIIFSKRQESVEGLTTAASILFAAAIGITVALEQIVMASILTLLVILILLGLGFVERKITLIREWRQKSPPNQS